MTGHPHIQFLLYVSGHKKLIFINCLPRLMPLVFPPPDGEIFLPTSVQSRRRLQTHNWQYAPRGRPRKVGVPPGSGARHGRLCWRPLGYGGDRPPATSRQLRQYVATAGP